MRRGLLIGVPVLILLLAAGLISMMTADSKYPIGPLAPFIIRQETFVVDAQPAADGPTLVTWAWVDGTRARGAMAEYRAWLVKDALWQVHSSSEASLVATHGTGLLPDANLNLDTDSDHDYLLIYSRHLTGVQAFVDGLIYKRRGLNSVMPSKKL